MANGMPSRRLQISTTAFASLTIEKCGATAWARSENSVAADESVPVPTSSDGTGHRCSSTTLNPSRLVAKTLTVAECARIASARSAAASRMCSQLSITNSRTRPSSALATDSLTVLPGCWVMPSTDATASGTAAGSVTAASSKKPDPVGKFIGESCPDLQRKAGLANPTYAGQRHQLMGPHRCFDLGALRLAPDETGDGS